MNCPCGESTLEEKGVNLVDARYVCNSYIIEGNQLVYCQWEDDWAIEHIDDEWTCGCGTTLTGESLAFVEAKSRGE